MMNQNVTKGRIEPVRKELTVKLPMEDAFRLFTEGINKWWPLATHSVWGEGAAACYFEGWVGGRIVEVSKHGEESEWGKVLVWEPFSKVAFQWYPDRTPATAQEVTIMFSETAEGSRLELIHSGWETLGDQALEKRNGYVTGWDFVLGKYLDAVNSL
jgi:hypothetical protein